jgi:transposase
MKLHRNARTCPHCRALIVSRVADTGQKPRTVAHEFRVTEATVRKWLTRFRAEGVAGLTDRSCRPGRIPRRYLQPGEELHDAVFAVLHTPPSDHGFNRTSWKLSDLGNVLRTLGKTSSQRNIAAVIKAAGYRWKQARVTLTSTDPNYRDKLEIIRSTLSHLAPDEAFFSIAGETIKLIEMIRDRYKGFRRIYLSWDAAPWHRSKGLHDRIEELNGPGSGGDAPEILIVPLPAGAQFLNVIESVFSGMSRAIIHNSDYTSVGDAKEAPDILKNETEASL